VKMAEDLKKIWKMKMWVLQVMVMELKGLFDNLRAKLAVDQIRDGGVMGFSVGPDISNAMGHCTIKVMQPN
jgi:hypothetical protein